MSQDACTAGIAVGTHLDIGNCRGECRKTLALRDYVWNPGLDIGNLGGEGRKTLAPQGLLLESREWISETSEVARLLHRRDYVWNPWYGYRFSRGGEDQEIVALRGLRLESRVRTSFIPRR